MHRFTRLLRESFSALQTYTTSATLAIDTPPFNIALQTPLHDSCPESPILKILPWMRKHGRKKMTTGHIPIHPKRMVLAVAAGVIPISLM